MAGSADIVALALDQSPMATGFAIGRPNGSKPVYGTYRLPSWKDAEGDRMVNYERWLTQLACEYRVTNLYYEAPFLPRHSDADAILPQIHVISVVTLVAAKLKIDIAKVPIDAWRKQAFGFCRLPVLKGDAARKEWKRMAKVLCLKRNLLIEDDNAAEAVLILDYGLGDADASHSRNIRVHGRRAELQHWMGDRR